MPSPADAARGPAFEAVAALVARARAAQAVADAFDQARVDELVAAAGWAILEPARNRELAELAVADTGIGDVEDKIRKNHRKTLGLLRDLAGMRTVGVIAEDAAKGLVEIARPVGVVCAVTPSTNPAATPANKIINALKARNAVIVAPSPKGASTCARLIEFVHAQFDRIGAPRDLVQMLPAPITKEATAELMRQCDLVVATGSQANVRAAYASGTPAFGVGAGNVASIVDETADLEAAAAKIVLSKTFDHATSCSSENSLVLVEAVADAMLAALARRGCVLLDAADRERLQEAMWPDGRLSPAVIGQAAGRIAAHAGLANPAAQAARVLLVEGGGVGPGHPFSGEKLSPVLAVYRVRDFGQAKETVRANLRLPGRRPLRVAAQRARGPRPRPGAHAPGGARDREPGARDRQRRQLLERPARVALDGLRHLGPQQLLRQPERAPVHERDARLAAAAGEASPNWTTCSARTSRAGDAEVDAAGDATVAGLIEAQAAARGQANYFTAAETGRTLAFGELAGSARRVSALLAREGCPPGAHVSVVMPNGLATVRLLLGAMAAGRCVNPVNLLSSPEQMRYVLDHSDSRAGLRLARLGAAPSRAGGRDRARRARDRGRSGRAPAAGGARGGRALPAADRRARAASPSSCTPRAPRASPRA